MAAVASSIRAVAAYVFGRSYKAMLCRLLTAPIRGTPNGTA
jgi:hypothetical protein